MANQVLDIIKDRHYSQSKPGKRSDNYKVALAIEGGGLRGIVTGGALGALEALRLRDSFDVVYGASCGAYSGSYFVSGDVLTGARFFLDYSQVQFVSKKRFLRGGPLFDLDYVEHIMHTATPLNYSAAIKARPPLHVVATEANRTKPMTIKNFKNAYELDRALKASSSVPAYGRPRPLIFQHRSYVDASIVDPFCIHSAIAEHCTHIVVLFSMPWRHRHVFRLVDKKLVAPYFVKINTNLAESYLRHGEYSVNGLSHIWNHYDGTHILTVAPTKSRRLPKQITTSRKRLGYGFLAGAEAVLNYFAPDEHTKELILASFKNELKI